MDGVLGTLWLALLWAVLFVVGFLYFDGDDSIFSSSRQSASPDREIAELANFMHRVKTVYPLREAMIRCMPHGMYLSNNNSNPVLRINGHELDPLNWEKELYFLELVDIPEYLTEIHLTNLPFNAFVIAYVMRLLKNNSNRLQTLTIYECYLATNYELNWDLTFLNNLSCFRLINTKLTGDDTSFLLANLPSSLRILHIAMKLFLPWHVLEFLFVQFMKLEELRFDGVELLCYSCFYTIFQMKNLKTVHFSAERAGNIILDLIAEYKPQWHTFILTSCKNVNNEWDKLLFLPSLTNLEISDCYLPLKDFVAFLTANLHHFPLLKMVRIAKNAFTKDISFANSLVNSGIKLQFQYEMVTMTNDNWKNYIAISTGIPIDFKAYPIIVEEMLSQLQYSKISSLVHITNITVQSCNSIRHIQSLLKLMTFVPNLKELCIEINSMDEVRLADDQIVQFANVETLKLDFSPINNSESILVSILKCFPTVKTIEFFYSKYFDASKLASLPPFKHLQRLNLNSKFDFDDAGVFFHWIATLPKLEYLEVWFGYNAVKNPLFFCNSNRHLIETLKPLKLKSLKFSFVGSTPTDYDLKVLFTKFPNLLELYFDTVDIVVDFYAVVSNFAHFPRLRRLGFAEVLTEQQADYIAENVHKLRHLTRIVCQQRWRMQMRYSKLRAACNQLPYFSKFVLCDL